MRHCEYFLVQYVSAPAADLRLPIGLCLLQEPGRLVRCAVTRSWRRVQCMDPHADLAVLAAIPTHLEQLAAEHAAPSGAFRDAMLRLSERGLGVVQIAGPRAVETDDPEREFERLFQEHVEQSRPAASRAAPRAGSRRWIYNQVRAGLERGGLLNRLQKNVAVAEFTAPGDAFQIDFSYRPNGVTKFLHAISLERDWNQAKVLSYTFTKIRQRQPASLTAIVADPGSELPARESCSRILLDTGIALQPISGLEAFLEQIRSEL